MGSIDLFIHVQYSRKHTDGQDYLPSVKCIFVSCPPTKDYMLPRQITLFIGTDGKGNLYRRQMEVVRPYRWRNLYTIGNMDFRFATSYRALPILSQAYQRKRLFLPLLKCIFVSRPPTKHNMPLHQITLFIGTDGKSNLPSANGGCPYVWMKKRIYHP